MRPADSRRILPVSGNQMNRWTKRFLFPILFFSLFLPSLYGQIPQTLSYQGVLTDANGEPITSDGLRLTFQLHTTPNNGGIVWREVHDSVPVQNGVFSVILGSIQPLDFPFDQPYFLGITVGNDQEMRPAIELTASAYSLQARTVSDSMITSRKIAAGTVVRSLNNLTGTVTLSAGSNIDIVNEGNNLIISTASENGTGAWSLTGNANTDSTHFLGTTDVQPLEIRVNGERAGRFEFTSSSEGPNIILGSRVNRVSPGVVGATISGGGDADDFGNANPNTVISRFGTVGGGAANTAGHDATVGGGFRNEAIGIQSTVAGGFSNTASSRAAAVGGGNSNQASGIAATIPGGQNNRAQGQNSLAAGTQAVALHEGTFVWADFSAGAAFESTASNQFLIRAAGGVGIGLNTPSSPLTVAGIIESTSGGFKFPDGSRQTTAAKKSPWNQTAQQKDIYYVDGNVGIGTKSPTNLLTLPKNSKTDPIADAWTIYSSRRWKTNIQPIKNPLHKVKRLRGVTYDWKTSGKHDIGLIAEEVGEVIPEVVVYEENGVDAKSVDYPRLVALLIEAMKEQQKQLDRITRQLDAWQKRFARINAKANNAYAAEADKE